MSRGTLPLCVFNVSVADGQRLSSLEMRMRPWLWLRRLLFVPCLGLLLVWMGCARSKAQYEEIFRDDGIRVQLAEKCEESGEVVPRGYDHPWDVEIGTLERLLGSVCYQKGKVLLRKDNPKEAFPPFARHALLKPIQEAFAQAGPDQAVDFWFIDERDTLKIFRRVYLTDGMMFRKEEKLNIAFRNLAFEDLSGVEGQGSEPNREDPTEKPWRTDWTLVPVEGQALVKGKRTGLLGSNTYSNWIQLDLSRERGVAEREAGEKAPAGAGEIGEAPEQDRPIPRESPDARPASGEEVEERLQFLEELYRDGAISEPSYLEKKRELEQLYEILPDTASP